MVELTEAEIGAQLQQFFDGKAERWTDGAFALDADGSCVGVHDAEAACYCLMGAVFRLFDDKRLANGEWLVPTARAAITKYVPLGWTVEKWNDTPGRTFSDVQKLLRKMQGL